MAPRKKKEKPFATEVALCTAFIAEATKDGKWTAYAETEGFDILMVRKADGLQVGIEAKLTLNTKVVNQALPDWSYDTPGMLGPDFRAVLVPHEEVQNGLDTICSHIGITVIRQRPPEPNASWRYGHGLSFNPALPDPRDEEQWYGLHHWHPWCPHKRLRVPDYVPDVVAGDSAPRQLSPWKVKAIKLAILLDERPVTRKDFKALKLSPSRWTERHHGWLDPSPQGYVRTRRMPDFRSEHPVNFAQIEADKPKWMADVGKQLI